MKLLRTIFILIVILAVVIVLGRNMIIKAGLEKGVKHVTGLNLSVETVQAGLQKPTIAITDMKLYNPKGYEMPVMVHIPEIYVDYNLNDILNKNIHLHDVRFELKELAVIKNAAGKLNIEALKPVKEGEETGKAAGQKPDEGKTAEMPEFQIDKLTLKIGRVIYKDYSVIPATEKVYDLNIDEQFENINDPHAFVNLVIMRALRETAIAQLSGFNLGNLESSVKDALGGLEVIGRKTVDEALGTIKEKIGEFKLPFGEEQK